MPSGSVRGQDYRVSPHGHRRPPDRTRRRRRRRLRRRRCAGRSPTAIGRPCEARDAQRALAETEGALAAERGAFDVRVENAIKALSTEALRENANAFTEQAMGRLGVFVEPLQKSLDKVEIERRPARAAAAAGLRRDPQGARALAPQQRGPEPADREPRQRPQGRVAHARALGRDPAAPRDRDGRDAAVLRLRGAADDSGRRRRHPPARRDREAAGQQVDRDRREGLAERAICGRTRRAPTTRRGAPAWPTTRGRCATTSRRLSQKAYWRQLPGTPDFVVMFMHDESSLARRARPSTRSCTSTRWRTT